MESDDEQTLISELVRYLDYTDQLSDITDSLTLEAKSMSSSPSVIQLPGSSNLNDSFSSFSSSVFPDGNQRLFHVQIRINVIQLADFHEDLAEMVMRQKKEFVEMLQFVIFKFSSCLEEEEEKSILKQSQILVTPVITGLADFYEHEVRKRRELSQVRSGCLMSASVRVSGISLTVKYVSSTSYRCTSSACEDFRDETEYVKVFSAVVGTKDHYECVRCMGRLEEQYRRRDVREVVPGLVKIQGSDRVVSVVFRQEDGARLQLGQQVVIVFTVESARSGDLILEVNSCELCPLSPLPAQPSPDSKIIQLLRNRDWSAWSFVASLAYVFCEDLVPPGAFTQLRLALLLSLVSAPSERLNVLAVGDEDFVFSRLMSEGTKLAGGQFYSSNISLTGSVSKGNLSYLECGHLHLARETVLFLGDVINIKQTVKEALVKAVETRQVSSSLPPVSSQPLTTALWGLASTSSVQPKRGHNSRLLSLLHSLQDISSSMDFIILNSDMSQESGEILSSFFMEPPEQPNKISMAEISSYLDYVKQLTVRTPADCKEFLQRYFLASRRVRPNCPQSAIMTLLKTAIAHARLAARDQVRKEDCVFACHFYEDMMTNLTGYSHLGHNAKSPVVGECSLDSLLGSGHEAEMKNFQFNLEKFIFDYSCNRDHSGNDEERLSTEE